VKLKLSSQEPIDACIRKAVAPVICYPPNKSIAAPMDDYNLWRQSIELIDEIIVPPREAKIFTVDAGYFFRISCVDGPQVGDLNLWSKNNLNEHFYSGKTRALYGTHLSIGDRLFSCFPYLRPLATITYDTLDWYGYDADGGSVHDVIGTRCDPYTHFLLSADEYHHCCHSNLTRALQKYTALSMEEAEEKIHDVLNVFMCTGFTKDTHQYFMKASPVRQGDFLEFFAEIDLIGGLSACPGGDCGSEHSSDVALCYPLKVEIYKPMQSLVNWQSPAPSSYSRNHRQQC
jgi:uncharacterized protein YcgI (DUF1989 family)